MIEIKRTRTGSVMTTYDGLSFKFASLDRRNLTGANLFGEDLRGANLREANLTDAYLDMANLENAHLDGANLVGARLRGANLTGATLRGANLINADLRGVNFTDADLSGAILSNAILSDANLTGTDLTDANLSEVVLSDTKTSLRIVTISGIGRTGAQTTYCFNTDTIWRGCFKGTLAEFEAEIELTHANNTTHLQEYRGLVSYLKILRELPVYRPIEAEIKPSDEASPATAAQ